jgi:hypothetical protein
MFYRPLAQSLSAPPIFLGLGFLLGIIVTLATLTLLGHPSANGQSPSAEAAATETGAGEGADLVVVPAVHGTARTRFLSVYRLPDTLTFAGRPIPLEGWQVRERLEYEFYSFLNDEGQSIILAKRTGRCFPPIEKQLREAGLPDDLKYVILVETKCSVVPITTRTGKKIRRQRTTVAGVWRDERRNLDASAERAIKRLEILRQQTGDWLLAIAAYTEGEDRVAELMREQHVHDYWKLYWARDTMRFMPRVIVAKEIFSHPQQYLGLTAEDLYAPVETEVRTITIQEPRRSLAAIAEEVGSYYLELKLLNPDITTDFLPRGLHRLRIPRAGCPAPCATRLAS